MLPKNLPQSITDRETARRFVWALLDAGISFHVDTPAEDYTHRSGHGVFDPGEECETVDRLRGEMQDHDFDPHEVALTTLREWEARPTFNKGEGGGLTSKPACLAGWEDTTWHNDAFPSCEKTFPSGRRYRVWVAEDEPTMREIEDVARFSVCLLDEEGSLAEDVWEGDDEAALAAFLATLTTPREEAQAERDAAAFAASAALGRLEAAQHEHRKAEARLNAARAALEALS